jgi:FkbM family methyltransferase
MLYRFIKFITSLLVLNYEKKLLLKLKLIQIEPKIIIDAGAHIGEYSKLFLKNFSKIKKIYCFEPQESIFKILKNNFKNNNKVKCINKALGHKVKKSFFNEGYHERSSTFLEVNEDSLFYKVKSLILFGKITNMIKKVNKVEVSTIDFYFNKKKNIDILKIDVEGYELNVLKGALTLIKQNKIKVLLIEITTHNMFKRYSSKKIESFLLENNFVLFSRHKFPLYPFEDRIYLHKSIKTRTQ